MEQEESVFLRHESCEACGSSDAKAVYSNGSSHCFSCGKSTRANGASKAGTVISAEVDPKVQEIYQRGDLEPLRKRGINADTCKKYGYKVVSINGKNVQLAPYYRDGNLVGLKTRDANKDFKWIGDSKKVELFGQHLFSGNGKRVIMTEGEIDCLSVSQVLGNRWPVVSVPGGAQGALRAVRANYEWLDGYDEIVVMFDSDEAGQTAAKEVADVLPAGKVKIAKLPLKDANEMLVAGRVEELMKAQYNAQPYRPDGIIDGSLVWDLVARDDVVDSVPYPFKGLNEKLRGIRTSELIVLTAGSGMGKSAIAREIAYHLILQDKSVGMIFLEESVKRTALGLMGLHINHPLHIDREGVSDERIKEAFEATMGSGRVFLYDHFGSTEVDNLLAKVRYMAKALDCKYIILDHLSIVVSGLDGNEDERRTIDRAMTLLRTLVQETGICLILISHLKRVENGGKSHESGAMTSLSHLRGSHSIAQLADIVIGLERNQQGEDPNKATLRVLKNRFTGNTGVACELNYDRTTGRLREEIFDVF